jgi:FtsH-binding integral membrane protein
MNDNLDIGMSDAISRSILSLGLLLSGAALALTSGSCWYFDAVLARRPPFFAWLASISVILTLGTIFTVLNNKQSTVMQVRLAAFLGICLLFPVLALAISGLMLAVF